MLHALKAAGWHNYSLFVREDGLLVGYLETPSLTAALEAMAGTEVNQRWQAEMAEFFVNLGGANPDTAFSGCRRSSTWETSSAVTPSRTTRRANRHDELRGDQWRLEALAIEVPSWAYGNSGTRFKVFGSPGTPRTVQDRHQRPPAAPTRSHAGSGHAAGVGAGGAGADDTRRVTHCILDSLALAYRRHVNQASSPAGREVAVVHVAGGGARNDFPCQLTADACGLPVLAGPAEASALGNVLVQARALGVGLPDLAAMRALVRRTHQLTRFEPRPGLDWAAAENRLAERVTS